MPEALVQYFKKFRKALNRIQQDLAKLSSKGKLVIAEKSGHMIPWEQPEIIVEAVKQMVEETKHEKWVKCVGQPGLESGADGL